jgi:hypothetical protein
MQKRRKVVMVEGAPLQVDESLARGTSATGGAQGNVKGTRLVFSCEEFDAPSQAIVCDRYFATHVLARCR